MRVTAEGQQSREAQRALRYGDVLLRPLRLRSGPLRGLLLGHLPDNVPSFSLLDKREPERVESHGHASCEELADRSSVCRLSLCLR